MRSDAAVRPPSKRSRTVSGVVSSSTITSAPSAAMSSGSIRSPASLSAPTRTTRVRCGAYRDFSSATVPSYSTRPWSIRMTREQSRSTSARSCVVLTTHDLADVERLCSRVILIDHGRVLYDGTVAELKSRYAPHRTLVVRVGAERRHVVRLDPVACLAVGADPDDMAALGAEVIVDDDT